MSSFPEAYERIKFATSTKTQVEIAELLEIRQSSISDAKRRNSVPAEWVMKLFEKFGLNPDWIKQGVGPMYLRTEDGYLPQEGPAMGLSDNVASPTLYGEPSTKSLLVTVHAMSCEYKDGAAHPVLPQVGKISLPLSHAEVGVQVVRMEAPNMQPTVQVGAYMGVDSSVKTPVSGMVYALYWPHEGLVIKRVFLDSDDVHYILRSDAADYPEVRLPAKTLQSRILGKVVWVLQQL